MLKLMYITNRPEIAKIVEAAGVDRLFVDMEYIGKSLRQCGMDTVQSHHTIEDIKGISNVLTNAELLVRINPIHEATIGYSSSKQEIDAAIEAGADILMLPYFKTATEVQQFVEMVNGRVKTMPLLETPEAAAVIDDILEIDGIDEIFVGLNDLSLGYGKKFMFEVLADGTVEALAEKIKKRGIPFGFGGLASLDKGLLPGKMVLKEHYRLGSSSVILSRSFCNTSVIEDLDKIQEIFQKGLAEIRGLEKECMEYVSYFQSNRESLVNIVREIAEKT